ncbi:hypothetical protein ACMTAS_0643 [Thermotoga neapolitana DSM 4359]
MGVNDNTTKIEERLCYLMELWKVDCLPLVSTVSL